jgi:hypothetical protein
LFDSRIEIEQVKRISVMEYARRSITTLFWGLILVSMALNASTAFADSIEGRLNGLGCASHGELCPVETLDTHIALEGDFILHAVDGKYYFIVNLDRAIKARHLLKRVRVEGRLNPEFNAIEARELWVRESGEFKLVWSLSMQDAQRRLMSRQRTGAGTEK